MTVQFRVHGQGKTLCGDGFALWYTKDRGLEGPVFGSADKFTGMAIFFDTYSNKGSVRPKSSSWRLGSRRTRAYPWLGFLRSCAGTCTPAHHRCQPFASCSLASQPHVIAVGGAARLPVRLLHDQQRSSRVSARFRWRASRVGDVWVPILLP